MKLILFRLELFQLPVVKNDVHVVYNHILDLNRDVTLTVMFKSQLIITLLIQFDVKFTQLVFESVISLLENIFVKLMHLKLEHLVNHNIKLVIHLIEEFIKLHEFLCNFTGSPGREFIDLFLDFGNHLAFTKVFVKAVLLILCNKISHTFRYSLQPLVAFADFCF